MKPNTCLVVDVWEGQLEIDEAALKAGGVAGIGIRINNMSGGHHMDAAFKDQWAQASGFVRFPYFVYNPWVDGPANYAWLLANMPNDAQSVAIDVEVAYPGYAANKYAGELIKFLNLCNLRWKTIIYTAEWFLPYLASWPKMDYWWAQYPDSNVINACATWDMLKIAMNMLDKPYNVKSVPGNVVMWQFSGDKLVLPGTLRKIDVNVFYGTEADLAAYFGASAPIPVPDPIVPNPDTIPMQEIRLAYIVDDIVYNAINAPFKLTRPTPGDHVRNGLPATVRVKGGAANNKYNDAWQNMMHLLNPNQINYMEKDGSGVHNNGDPNCYEELTMAGNIVEILSQDGDKYYIRALSLNDAPPAPLAPNIADLSTTMHYFTAEMYNSGYLDMTTCGRNCYFPLAVRGGERPYIDAHELVPYLKVNIDVTVKTAVLNVRLITSSKGKSAGFKIYGNKVHLYGIAKIGPEYWGRTGVNTWICLYQYGWMTDWRPV